MLILLPPSKLCVKGRFRIINCGFLGFLDKCLYYSMNQFYMAFSAPTIHRRPAYLVISSIRPPTDTALDPAATSFTGRYSPLLPDSFTRFHPPLV